MDSDHKISRISHRRVLVKGILLFLLIDFLFTWLHPLPTLGRISGYNFIFPGRLRLPFGEKPDQAYNLSLYNLEAMFASHELVNGAKPSNEYRVLVLGDSSVWGYLLIPENTISSYLSAANININGDRVVKAYNIGYPTMSLAKDLLILNYAMRYKPDLIVWLVTLESFPVSKQLDSPIVQNNPLPMRVLIHNYSLNLDIRDRRFVNNSFLGSTLIGQRRAIADIFRLQFYGVMWAATGIDQYYPPTYEPPQEDLENDEDFYGLEPPKLNASDLSFDILSAGKTLAGDTPILFVNEPIYLSNGQNSHIRYNFFYPRWAYDQYRMLLNDLCINNGWSCMDEWNLISPDEFTNSAIHMNSFGTQTLATEIAKSIQSIKKP